MIFKKNDGKEMFWQWVKGESCLTLNPFKKKTIFKERLTQKYVDLCIFYKTS